MIDSTALPKVTIALLAYNQEEFIEAAVRSVLAQDYSSLEIILSDDLSGDKTFNIISTLAKNYNGSHNVLINRNQQNLGIAGHINTLMHMATGDLIVLAAGDDISQPYRVSRLVDTWLSNNKPPALCSDFEYIDCHGNTFSPEKSVCLSEFMPLPGEPINECITRFIQTGAPSLVGCTEAWSKRLVDDFPDLITNLWYEDKAYSFRAWLKGNIYYLNEKLVKYRIHETNVSISNKRMPKTMNDVISDELIRNKMLDRTLAQMQNHLNDINHLQKTNRISDALYQQLCHQIEAEVNRLKLMLYWWDKNYLARLHTAIKYLLHGATLPDLKWLFFRLMPFRLYAYLKMAKST